MKKILYSLCFLWLGCISCLTGNSQSFFTEDLFPQYMYANGTSAGDLVPYVFRATLTGLQPGTVYYYSVHAVLTTDSKPGVGSGYSIVASENSAFTLYNETGPNPPNGGSFTADSRGGFSGWFTLIPVSHRRFRAGTSLQLEVIAQPTSGGSAVGDATFFYSTNTVKVLNWGGSSTQATAIRSTAATGAKAKNFVMLYATENPVAGDRPVSGAVVENDGYEAPSSDVAAVYYSDFYVKNVDKVDKAWGALLPNDLATGLRKIVRYNFDGTEAGSSSSADGSWAGVGETVTTVNPSGGTSAVIVLDGSIVTLPAPVVIKNDPELAFAAGFPSEVYTGAADFTAVTTSKSTAPLTYSSSSEAVATVDAAGVVHVVGAGTTEIKVIQAEDATYYADTVVKTLLVTVPKSIPKLAFSASFPASVITGSPDFNAGVTSDAPAVITYSSSNAAVATIDANGLIHLTGIGSTDITATQAEDASYTAATVTKTLTVVDKQVPEVVFLPISARIYGDASFDAGATASSGVSPVYSTNNAAVAKVVDGKIVITGAGTAVITAVFPANASYSQNTASQTLVVDKKALSIIADDKSRKQGEANPLFTVKYSGFVNDDNNVNALQTQPQVTTTATTASPAGNYLITISGATASNYAISYVPGNLVVEVVLLENVITFPVISMKTYGQADFEAGAVAGSGLAISYSSSNAEVAVVAGTKIHITGAGTTVITASQAGDATHAAATAVTQTLTVGKALLAVAAKNVSKKQGEANPGFTVTYDGFVNGDNQAVLTTLPVATSTAVTASAAGIYPITVSGGGAADYDLVYISGKLTIYPVTGENQDDLMAYCDAPGRLKINLNVQTAVKVNIQLFTASGKKVLDMPASLAKGFNSFYVNTDKLAAGIYPLRVSGGDLLLKSKVIIR